MLAITQRLPSTVCDMATGFIRTIMTGVRGEQDRGRERKREVKRDTETERERGRQREVAHWSEFVARRQTSFVVESRK